MVVVAFAPDEEEEDLLWPLPLTQAFATGSGEVGMMLEAIMFFAIIPVMIRLLFVLCLFYLAGGRGFCMYCLLHHVLCNIPALALFVVCLLLLSQLS